MTAPRRFEALDVARAEAKKKSRSGAKHKPKVAIRASVRLDAYRVLSDALYNVGRCAVFRALKHRDETLPADLIDAIDEHVHRETMRVLCDLLRFDEVEP